jgi:predicted ATPase
LQTVRETGQRLQEAELYRLKGELLLKTSCDAPKAEACFRQAIEIARLLKTSCDAPKAEACFRQAIEIARRQQAKWWELRATVSLARLLANQGRGDEARAMLAEIYKWFTEGLDLPDLKDAKTLLDELTV